MASKSDKPTVIRTEGRGTTSLTKYVNSIVSLLCALFKLHNKCVLVC